MKPLDFIAAIELAYDRSRGDTDWLDDITRLVAPAFSSGPPTTSFFFNLTGQDAVLGKTSSVGDRTYGRDDYARLHEEGKAIQISPRIAYECDVIAVLSRVIGPQAAAQMIGSAGMVGVDALGLRANTTSESGIIFTTFVSPGYRIRHRNLWTRFAAHVGSALRLRRTHAAHAPDSASAVLSPLGRLEHGSEAAIAARKDLAGAAKDMDRARGKLRRLDPDAASALWRAMVRGEWSLVDWYDHDGKRFVLAQSNKVPVRSQQALTEREQQVVACAAMGHSNKLIAYDLGLSTGSVSVILRRAATKLGVSGRTALIRAFRESRGGPSGSGRS